MACLTSYVSHTYQQDLAECCPLSLCTRINYLRIQTSQLIFGNLSSQLVHAHDSFCASKRHSSYPGSSTQHKHTSRLYTVTLRHMVAPCYRHATIATKCACKHLEAQLCLDHRQNHGRTPPLLPYPQGKTRHSKLCAAAAHSTVSHPLRQCRLTPKRQPWGHGVVSWVTCHMRWCCNIAAARGHENST
jgi:hypothetical protein